MPLVDRSPDEALEQGIERLLTSIGAKWDTIRAEIPGAGYSVEFRIKARPELNLDFSIAIVGDQMEVRFNDCYLIVEESAFMPRLARNLESRRAWRDECLAIARRILTRDLCIETRWRRGRLLGGYLYNRNGAEWERVGGGSNSLIFAFGERKYSEYSNWRLPA
jgi:hypothetical protein